MVEFSGSIISERALYEEVSEEISESFRYLMGVAKEEFIIELPVNFRVLGCIWSLFALDTEFDGFMSTAL